MQITALLTIALIASSTPDGGEPRESRAAIAKPQLVAARCPTDQLTMLSCPIGRRRTQMLCAHETRGEIDHLAVIRQEAKTSRVVWSAPVLDVHLDRWSSGAMHGLTLTYPSRDSIFLVENSADGSIAWVEHRIGSKTVKTETCVGADEQMIDETYDLNLPFSTSNSQTEGAYLSGTLSLSASGRDSIPAFNEVLATEAEPKSCKSSGEPEHDVLQARVISVSKRGTALHSCRAYLGNQHIRGVPAVFLGGVVGACVAIVDCGADGVFRGRMTLGAASATLTLTTGPSPP